MLCFVFSISISGLSAGSFVKFARRYTHSRLSNLFHQHLQLFSHRLDASGIMRVDCCSSSFKVNIAFTFCFRQEGTRRVLGGVGNRSWFGERDIENREVRLSLPNITLTTAITIMAPLSTAARQVMRTLLLAAI